MSNTIICFGKNYQDHMHELGDKPVEKPVIFLKPVSVLHECSHWNDTAHLFFPDEEIHYECEMVFKLKSGGFKLSEKEAQESLGWYTVGLDMTKRNLQKKLKGDGHPWTTAKVSPDAAVIGPWILIERIEEIQNHSYSFSLNGDVRQQSNGNKMLFSPIDLVVYASQYFPLCEGDILFTGTPSGVGKILKDDIAEVKMDGLSYLVKWIS